VCRVRSDAGFDFPRKFRSIALRAFAGVVLEQDLAEHPEEHPRLVSLLYEEETGYVQLESEELGVKVSVNRDWMAQVDAPAYT